MGSEQAFGDALGDHDGFGGFTAFFEVAAIGAQGDEIDQKAEDQGQQGGTYDFHRLHQVAVLEQVDALDETVAGAVVVIAFAGVGVDVVDDRECVLAVDRAVDGAVAENGDVAEVHVDHEHHSAFGAEHVVVEVRGVGVRVAVGFFVRQEEDVAVGRNVIHVPDEFGFFAVGEEVGIVHNVDAVAGFGIDGEGSLLRADLPRQDQYADQEEQQDTDFIPCHRACLLSDRRSRAWDAWSAGYTFRSARGRRPGCLRESGGRPRNGIRR